MFIWLRRDIVGPIITREYPCMWLFTVEFQRKFNVMQHKIPKAQIARGHV
jgi:hypothetical protein